MNTKYTERLILFANHLRGLKKNYLHSNLLTINLVALERKVRVNYTVNYQAWIFPELVSAFPEEWYFDASTGIPVLKGAEQSDESVSSVIDFFDLNLDEFCHLFDATGFQSPHLYAGIFLTPASMGDDYAHNIHELVKTILSDTEPGMKQSDVPSEVVELKLLDGKILVIVSLN